MKRLSNTEKDDIAAKFGKESPPLDDETVQAVPIGTALQWCFAHMGVYKKEEAK